MQHFRSEIGQRISSYEDDDDARRENQGDTHTAMKSIDIRPPTESIGQTNIVRSTTIALLRIRITRRIARLRERIRIGRVETLCSRLYYISVPLMRWIGMCIMGGA